MINMNVDYSAECKILSKSKIMETLKEIQSVDNIGLVNDYFNSLLGKFYSFPCSICDAEKHFLFRNVKDQEGVISSQVTISPETCLSYFEMNQKKYKFYINLQKIFSIVNSISCEKEGTPVVKEFFEINTSQDYIEHYEECTTYLQSKDNYMHKNVGIFLYNCLLK